MSPTEIYDQIKDRWVCITGGEPTIHKLARLVRLLKSKGHKIALETNGTGFIVEGIDWICVSPKDQWPRPENFAFADEIKLLVGSGMYNVKKIISKYPSWTEKASLLPVWDENYSRNLEYAIGLCQKYQVRLAVQIHKYLEVK